MQISTLFRPPRTACLAGAALAAALLTGCALPPAGTPPATAAAVTGSATAPLITAPPTSVGTWYDLGHVMAPWLGGDAPVPVSGPNAPTRVAGLRREDGHWLAIVVAQVAPAGSAPCPAPTSLHVVGSSADGVGCLRLRRDADFDRWLQQQHSVLYQWLDQRDLTSRPRAWISDRVPSGAGGAIETHALVDPSLIEPTTRTNIDFLEGGQPGLQWARQFAVATRVANGALQVPPFPFAPQLAPPAPPPPVVVAPPPTRATQVLPERPQPPRRDRE